MVNVVIHGNEATARRLCLPAQGCRPRLPWETEEAALQPQRGCVRQPGNSIIGFPSGNWKTMAFSTATRSSLRVQRLSTFLGNSERATFATATRRPSLRVAFLSSQASNDSSQPGQLLISAVRDGGRNRVAVTATPFGLQNPPPVAEIFVSCSPWCLCRG